MIISYKPAPARSPEIVRKRRAHPEEDQQAAFVKFLELEQKMGRVVLFSASAASTPAGHKDGEGKWIKHRGSNQRNVRMGVRSGVPDMEVLLHAANCDTVVSLRIEFKHPKASPSDFRPDQRQWVQALNDSGQYACVAFSCAAAIEMYRLARCMRRSAFLERSMQKSI